MEKGCLGVVSDVVEVEVVVNLNVEDVDFAFTCRFCKFGCCGLLLSLLGFLDELLLSPLLHFD